MEFYFHPSDEDTFKEKAVNNYVRTIVFDSSRNEIITSFVRKVRKLWEQTCKSNIETDRRIKKLPTRNYQVFSWIVKSKNALALPEFYEIKS